MSTVAIVPAKRFAAAKQRLAPALEPSWRRRLAAAMLADVLASLRLTAGIEETLLVSRDPDAADLADEHGAADLATDADRSLSSAIAVGVRAAVRGGASRIAIVAADCPLLDPAELDGALARLGAGPAVAIFPDRHGAGTNAMALAPPQALTPAFGPRSLAGHIAAATAAGLPPRLEHSSSLALDVDTKADLDLLCELLGRQPERAPHSAALLRERCTESVK